MSDPISRLAELLEIVKSQDSRPGAFPSEPDAHEELRYWLENNAPYILNVMRASVKVQKAYWQWLNNDPEWRIHVNLGGPLPMEAETKELESALVALHSAADAEATP